MEDFTQLINNGNPVDVVYLDFEKAFDTAPHQRLMCKLASYGIISNICNWIEDFLSNKSRKVRVGKNWSKKAEVLSRIPHGSVLIPILFRIFINNLPECVQSCCNVFVDGTKIYDSACNCTKIEEDIYKVQEWPDMWNLYFNVTKCKVMHKGRKKRRS